MCGGIITYMYGRVGHDDFSLMRCASQNHNTFELNVERGNARIYSTIHSESDNKLGAHVNA